MNEFGEQWTNQKAKQNELFIRERLSTHCRNTNSVILIESLLNISYRFSEMPLLEYPPHPPPVPRYTITPGFCGEYWMILHNTEPINDIQSGEISFPPLPRFDDSNWIIRIFVIFPGYSNRIECETGLYFSIEQHPSLNLVMWHCAASCGWR